MNIDKFIEPKTVKIGKAGSEREYIISLIPAVDALEIHNVISEFIAKNGLIGITMLPVPVKRRIISYTAFVSNNVKIVPETDQLINDIFGRGHISEFEELVILMAKENFDFLITGDLLEKLSDGQTEATDSAS